MNTAHFLGAWRAVAAGVAVSLAAVAAAEDDFAVVNVWFEKSAAGFAPRAELQIRQTERMQDILEVGYDLQLLLELRFLKRRDWWFDEELGNIDWRGVLSYDAYSKRHVLNVGGSTKQFRSLAAAVDAATRIRAQPSAAPRFTAIFEQDGVYLSARFSMPIDNLPEPIQIDLLVDDEWDTGGAWTTLPLTIQPAP